MTFTVTIDCDNSAFDPDPADEIARILREIAAAFEQFGRYQFERVYDVNGNAIGRVTLT